MADDEIITDDDIDMIEVEVEEKKLMSWKAKREQELGFRPQQEVFHNFHLPYNVTDQESANLLDHIKNQLGRAVAYREMYPSTGIYITKLMSYIKLYGLKFSKDDHVQLIVLLLKIALIPDLDPAKLNKCSIILSELLRKSHLLSPDDLQIQWRPLYKLAKIYIDKRGSKGELIRFYSKTDEKSTSNSLNWLKTMISQNYGFDLDIMTNRETTLEQNILFLIQLCAPYFPKSANQEILNELLPQLQPLDNGKAGSEFEFLSIFLSPYSYELWLDHFMELWNVYHYPVWNLDIMNLVASTAANTIGLIDWTPHIPLMFTRILRSLELPVSYKQIKSSKNQSLCADASATWIIAILGPKYDGMRYLRNFFSTIESYLNIANSGKWVRHISDLLVQLVKYFQQRLISERYKKHPWKPEIPHDFRLRDQDITEFVEVFKPIAMIAMYSRMNTNHIGKIFKGLAELRPELILPGIIERVCITAETTAEPHKFTAALSSLSSVANVIVSGRRGTEESRTQLIPIMFSVLPGIDSNDFKKTSITFQFLITVSILLPIVDCSRAFLYHDDLSEEERLICEQTATFEDFVLQFLDRMFVLIESSSVETTRMEHSSYSDNSAKSKLESIAEALIQSAGHSILGQCSQEILDSATKKLINYIKGSRAMEPRVAGAAMSSLCRVFARVNGKDTYRALIPFLTEYIETHFKENDAIEMEKQRDDFLYYLQLLTTLIRGHPHEVSPYIDTLLPIIDVLLKCKCKTTARSGAQMISHLMIIFSTIQTNDIKTVPLAFTKPLSEFLPIRHWGRKMDREEKFVWFMPGENERVVCEKLIHHYLLPVLERFQQHINGTQIISRDQILIDLHVISAILKCNNFLSNWNDEEAVKLMDSISDNESISLTLGFNHFEVKMPDGSNVKKCLINILDSLQRKILTDNEDDIKSLKQLLAIWDKIHMRSHSNQSYENQLKSYQISKQFQEYKLCRKRKDIRAVVATRIIIQQDLRDEISTPVFTPTHRKIMLNLIALSTSQYSSIRSTAQSTLFKMFGTYFFAYRSVTDDIVKYLQLDPNENHEAFKGALYLIGTNRRHRLMLRNDWETIQKLWTAFFKTQLSEKHSIVRLMESITEGIHNEFQTIATVIEVSDEIARLGANLTVDKSIISPNYLELGASRLKERNQHNCKLYYSLIDEILEFSKRSSLHWRYHLLCSTLINDLMHPVSKYPPQVTEIFVKNLIHDSIEERSFALRICNTVLKQQKRHHVKIEIDPFEMTGTVRNSNELLKPGIREDNKWLWYDNKNLPRNQAQWDEPKYVYKTNGFFGWTTKVEVYAPNSQQPKIDRSYEELNEHEKAFFDFFSDSKNVDKLIEYWSLEEKKGKEKFQRSRFWFLKQMFDFFGDAFLDPLLKHLELLILNKKNESSHRCAAELMAAMMRGAKHWNYEKTKNMYDKLIPLIKLALNNITSESDGIWGCGFATAAEGIDPNKQHFLHETLLENPINEIKSSFTDCSRLYCLQGAFNQHVWRMGSVAHRLLNYLDPFLNHPFQNVRDRIGSTLINIFENDMNFETLKSSNYSPHLENFLAAKHNELMLLKNEENVNHVINPDTEYAASIRLFKAIAQFLTGVINRCTNGNEKVYFEFLSIGARLEKCEHDKELAEACSVIFALMAQALTQPSCMDEAFVTIEELSHHTSWSVRLSIIDIMQVLVFNNMAIVYSRIEWIEKVQSIVLRLLEDNVLEVREKSAQVLGGLIHCSFLPATEKLLELFKKKCKTKVFKRSNQAATTCSFEEITPDINSIRIRHCGVLGLCAFIQAYPYDIPEFVPNVFEIISNHMNDPQPIPTTIRKTLADFKRTHHDGWDFHQLKFTESQLAVLSDLNVPPSYVN